VNLNNYLSELDIISKEFSPPESDTTATILNSEPNSPSHTANMIETNTQNSTHLIVMNLCDGLESDGYPGIRVVKELERRGLPFTGASSTFFEITTSKILMKELMIRNQVPTSPFVQMHLETLDEDISKADKLIGFPMIVKLDMSFGSCGINDKSVVWTAEQARTQVKSIWHEAQGRVFVEKFLAGREFTALVTGCEQTGFQVQVVAERAFDQSLDRYQRFLAFDRSWEGYDLKGNRPAVMVWFVQYRLAPLEFANRLGEVALDAYRVTGGTGYGRVDLRTDSDDLSVANVFVLEVNSQVLSILLFNAPLPHSN